MNINIVDRGIGEFSASTNRKLDENGFLSVKIRAAKVGVQHYLASELAPPPGADDPYGLRELPPHKKIGVLRDADEVAKSVKGFRGMDITKEASGSHPSSFLNSENWKEHSAGTIVGDGELLGDWVYVDGLIKDKSVIDSLLSGDDAFVSPGYATKILPSNGKHNGESYTFKQKDITPNHLSIVNHPRGGKDAKILDSKEPEKMAVVKIKDQSVNVGDDNAAAMITGHIEAIDSDNKKLTAKLKDSKTELEKSNYSLSVANEKIAALETKVSDSSINSIVASVTKKIADAKTLVGEDFTTTSVTDSAIAREAMSVSKPDRDWSKISDEVILYAFDEALFAKQKELTEQDNKKQKANNSHLQFTKDSTTTVDLKDADAVRKKAREDYEAKRYSNK